MKLLWIFAVFCVAVFASVFDQDDTRINGENGWYVPQVDGSFDWVNIDDAESYLEARKEIKENRITANPVKFYLYTRSNPTKGKQIIANAESDGATYFNPQDPTRFIIHGWTQSYSSSMNKQIRDAWLSLGDYNIIVVDWARARSIDYGSSVLGVPKAGEKVAQMIDFLVSEYGMSLDTLYVIGHSLGAHVAGYAGKNVNTGQIHTIIGLDPALPLFHYNKPHKRLNKTDAFYVESIHTCGGKLGFLKPIGKGAFYPNGGKSQPGCYMDIAGNCAHSRSVTYYVEAILNDNFGSYKCKDYDDAVAQNCGGTYSSIRMGSIENSASISGNFYVPINSKAPYGMIS